MIINQINILKKELNSLMIEYNHYMSFFKTESKALEKADLRYYCYLMDLLEVDPYDEGKFSLDYIPLWKKINENKEKRKVLAIKLKLLKEKRKLLDRKNQVL